MALNICTSFASSWAAHRDDFSVEDLDQYVTDVASPGLRIAQWHNALGLEVMDATEVDWKLPTWDERVLEHATQWYSFLPSGEEIMQDYAVFQDHSSPVSSYPSSNPSPTSHSLSSTEPSFAFHLDLSQAPEGFADASLEECLDRVGAYKDVFNLSTDGQRPRVTQVGIASPKPVRLGGEVLVAQLHQAALEALGDAPPAHPTPAPSDGSSTGSYNLFEEDGSFTTSSSTEWSIHVDHCEGTAAVFLEEVSAEHQVSKSPVIQSARSLTRVGRKDVTHAYTGMSTGRHQNVVGHHYVHARSSQTKHGRPSPPDFAASRPPTDGDLVTYLQSGLTYEDAIEVGSEAEEDDASLVEVAFPGAPSMGSVPLPNIGGDALYDDAGIMNWRFATLRGFATEDEVAELSPISPIGGNLFADALF
ncbi:hypothetical protein FA95DRAFT_1571630 [Auriscalpium vulgare]|uniref:Uncharacterized protein n=1 Tax=Auriscalpium vulgare TaxID=40419 RepID=A0ACB8RYY3_9AGAM|nr:hypothetical protein FA95DRAFT_1571630 [Auriscalpium vulgare]